MPASADSRDGRVLLVRNPASGSASEVDLDALIDALGGRGRVADVTAGPDDLEEVLASEAPGADLVVAAGGDGTVHAVLQSLGSIVHETTLGVIPLGTGNDLATTLGMPDDPLEAAGALAEGRDRPIDLGVASSDGGPTRRFLNASIGGFPVAVDDAVNDWLKRTLGPAAYTIAGAKVAADLPRFTVTIDGRTLENCVAAGVGNGRTVGGGIPMWPGADPSDGLLDGCAVAAEGLVDAVKLGMRVREGSHGELPGVVTVRAREIRIEADPEMEMNVDGELVGMRTPVTFRLDGTITMRVPG